MRRLIIFAAALACWGASANAYSSYEAKLAGACRIAMPLASAPHLGVYIAAACKDEASIHALSLDSWSLAWLNRITVVARGQQ